MNKGVGGGGGGGMVGGSEVQPCHGELSIQ